MARALVLVALLLAAPSVLAQGRDPAAAEALFTEGRKAFDAGDYRIACARFAESQRLDPAVGTLINLAACNEKLDNLALAWETWQQALRAHFLWKDIDQPGETDKAMVYWMKRLDS